MCTFVYILLMAFKVKRTFLKVARTAADSLCESHA